MPGLLRPLLVRNPRRLYNILFAAAWEALRSVAAEEKHLGARVGAVAVLHTWSQTLGLHPHIHCLVPAGGLAADGARWIASAGNFLVPVRVLSARFRSVFLDALSTAYRTNDLDLGGDPEPLRHPVRFEDLVAELMAKPWVVFSKAPFAAPATVLRYLARYTHRVAISNERLRSMAEGHVTFSYKDYRSAGERKLMSLEALELIRRFLLHVLPRRFVRVRYFGVLSNRHRAETTRQLRLLFDVEIGAPDATEASTWEEQLTRLVGTDPTRCRNCGQGRLVLLRQVPAARRQRAPP